MRHQNVFRLTTTLRGLVLSVVLTVFAGCASDRIERAETPCQACGRVVAIAPASGKQISPLPEGARISGSSRVLTPSPALASEVARRTGDLRVMGLGGDAVPVYRLRDSGMLSRRAAVTLEMDGGGIEKLLVEDAQFLAVGDRVRRVGNRLMPDPDDGGAFAR